MSLHWWEVLRYSTNGPHLHASFRGRILGFFGILIFLIWIVYLPIENDSNGDVYIPFQLRPVLQNVKGDLPKCNSVYMRGGYQPWPCKDGRWPKILGTKAVRRVGHTRLFYTESDHLAPPCSVLPTFFGNGSPGFHTDLFSPSLEMVGIELGAMHAKNILSHWVLAPSSLVPGPLVWYQKPARFFRRIVLWEKALFKQALFASPKKNCCHF